MDSTSIEERRKREREKREKEEQSQRSEPLSQMTEGSESISSDRPRRTDTETSTAKAREQGGSKLTVSLKYWNQLPDSGHDMKFLEYPFDRERFIAYKPFSLEQTVRHELLTRPEEAVPIDLTNPGMYEPVPGATLSEEESRLLSNLHKTQRKHIKPAVSWLKRTEYISAESGNEVLYTRRQSAQPRYESAASLDDEADLTIDEQLKTIDQAFADANTPLESIQHPSRKGVTAVKQWHVFPDFQLWENDYHHVTFADDPAPPPTEDQEPGDVEELCSGGLVHALESETGENYVVFAVPCLDKNMFEDLEAFEEKDHSEKTYRLVREFSMNFGACDDGREWFLILDDETETASYNELTKKLELRKRQKEEDSITSRYPGEVAVEVVEMGEEDRRVRDDRMKELVEDEAYAVPMDTDA